MGKRKFEGQEPEDEEMLEEEGVEASDDTSVDMGESGQEPRDEVQPQEGDGQPKKGKPRIDLEKLPDDVRAAFEHLLEQVREKNREARNLRRRLQRLERSIKERQEATGEGPTDQESDDLARLKAELEAAKMRERALLERLRRESIRQALRDKALEMGFRPDALDLVEKAVLSEHGDEIWDEGKGAPDKEALEDYLDELRWRKRFLLKPKPQKKPKVNEGAGRQSGGRRPVIDDDEIARRFGL